MFRCFWKDNFTPLPHHGCLLQIPGLEPIFTVVRSDHAVSGGTPERRLDVVEVEEGEIGRLGDQE